MPRGYPLKKKSTGTEHPENAAAVPNLHAAMHQEVMHKVHESLQASLQEKDLRNVCRLSAAIEADTTLQSFFGSLSDGLDMLDKGKKLLAAFVKKIKPNDVVDIQTPHEHGVSQAKILEYNSRATNPTITIHYQGWSDKHDRLLPLSECAIFPEGTFTKYTPATREKEREAVDEAKLRRKRREQELERAAEEREEQRLKRLAAITAERDAVAAGKRRRAVAAVAAGAYAANPSSASERYDTDATGSNASGSGEVENEGILEEVEIEIGSATTNASTSEMDNLIGGSNSETSNSEKDAIDVWATGKRERPSDTKIVADAVSEKLEQKQRGKQVVNLQEEDTHRMTKNRKNKRRGLEQERETKDDGKGRIEGDREGEDRNDWLCAVCREYDCFDGSQLTICEGSCLRSFHVGCMHAVERQEAAAEGEWLCGQCKAQRHECFLCGVAGKDLVDVFKCSLGSCGKFYHRACLENNPYAKTEIVEVHGEVRAAERGAAAEAVPAAASHESNALTQSTSIADGAEAATENTGSRQAGERPAEQPNGASKVENGMASIVEPDATIGADTNLLVGASGAANGVPGQKNHALEEVVSPTKASRRLMNRKAQVIAQNCGEIGEKGASEAENGNGTARGSGRGKNVDASNVGNIGKVGETRGKNGEKVETETTEVMIGTGKRKLRPQMAEAEEKGEKQGEMEVVGLLFRCPRHQCDTCSHFYRTANSRVTQKGAQNELFPCLYCPRAFHINCIEPGSRFNSSCVLCSNHPLMLLPSIDGLTPSAAAAAAAAARAYAEQHAPLNGLLPAPTATARESGDGCDGCNGSDTAVTEKESMETTSEVELNGTVNGSSLSSLVELVETGADAAATLSAGATASFTSAFESPLKCSVSSTAPENSSFVSIPPAVSIPECADPEYTAMLNVFWDQLMLPDGCPDQNKLTDNHFRLQHRIQRELESATETHRSIQRNDYDSLSAEDRDKMSVEVPEGVICSCVDKCDENCLNRVLRVECFNSNKDKHTNCAVGLHCTNRALQLKQYPATRVFREHEMGRGLKAGENIEEGRLVVEYVGEVIGLAEVQRRMRYQRQFTPNDRDFYIMELTGSLYVDGKHKGSVSRFINHSCDPNCELQRWVVLNQMRIAIVAIRDIAEGEPLSYDYQFDTNEDDAFVCYCGTAKCRGTMAPKKKSHHLRNTGGSSSGSGIGKNSKNNSMNSCDSSSSINGGMGGEKLDSSGGCGRAGSSSSHKKKKTSRFDKYNHYMMSEDERIAQRKADQDLEARLWTLDREERARLIAIGKKKEQQFLANKLLQNEWLRSYTAATLPGDVLHPIRAGPIKASLYAGQQAGLFQMRAFEKSSALHFAHRQRLMRKRDAASLAQRTLAHQEAAQAAAAASAAAAAKKRRVYTPSSSTSSSNSSSKDDPVTTEESAASVDINVERGADAGKDTAAEQQVQQQQQQQQQREEEEEESTVVGVTRSLEGEKITQEETGESDAGIAAEEAEKSSETAIDRDSAVKQELKKNKREEKEKEGRPAEEGGSLSILLTNSQEDSVEPRKRGRASNRAKAPPALEL